MPVFYRGCKQGVGKISGLEGRKLESGRGEGHLEVLAITWAQVNYQLDDDASVRQQEEKLRMFRNILNLVN